jgi:hypothetical protein
MFVQFKHCMADFLPSFLFEHKRKSLQMKLDKVAALVWLANEWQSARCSLRPRNRPGTLVESGPIDPHTHAKSSQPH